MAPGYRTTVADPTDVLGYTVSVSGNDRRRVTLQQLIAANARRIRDERHATQDDVATWARTSGLGHGWTRAVVAAFENGNRDVGLDEFPLLALALGVPVTDLLAGDDDLPVTLDPPGTTLRLDRVRYLFCGGDPSGISADEPVEEVQADDRDAALQALIKLQIQFWLHPDGTDEDWGLATEAAFSEADRDAARRLGQHALFVAVASRALWNRSLTEERDARAEAIAAPGATRATVSGIKGRMTRVLVAELDQHFRDREAHHPTRDPLWSAARPEVTGSTPGRRPRS
jgi:transcriptional regulator with XRE-family HTH domain